MGTETEWLDSGPGIEAMSDYVTDTAAPNAYVATRDEVRHWPKYGRWASGKDLRYYVRRYYPGGEAQFVIDHKRGDDEMAGNEAVRKARAQGQLAATKNRPRNTNPYAQSGTDGKKFEAWDTQWKITHEEKGGGR